MIYRIILIIPIFLFLSSITAAQNLVPNGGFENYTSLPNGYAQYYLATGWSNVNGSTSGPPYGSPDYYNSLGNTPGAFGPITPNSGTGQMGFYTYHASLFNAREYIGTQLSSPLVQGQEYQLTFYLTNGLNSSYTGTCDNMGIHFSTNALTQSVDEVIQLTPTIEIPGIISHQNYWQEYTYTFTAGEAAEYITFGNFELDAATTIVGGTRAYYFIDDIELVEIVSNPILEVEGDTSICVGESSILTATNGTSYAWADSTSPTSIISTNATITVTPTVTTTYLVYGTSDTTSITVNVYDTPVIDLGDDTTLCEGETLILNASTPNATYLWHNNFTIPAFNVTEAGTYWVEVTVGNCSTIDTIHIDYIPNPTLDLGEDAILCEGETLILDATTVGANGYLWQDNSPSSTYTVTESGTYSVEVTIGNCSTTETIDIIYIPTPTLDLGDDVTLCEGETLVLDGSTSGASYLWQDNSMNSTYTVSEAGIYWLEVTVNNCTTIDTINVSYNSVSILDLGEDITLCEGETLLLDGTTSGASYLWQDNSMNSTFTVSEAGIYWLEITVDNCTIIDTINVSYTSVPMLDLGEDIILCEGETLVLDGTTSGASYLWQDNSMNSTFMVSEEGIYWLEITVDNCTTTDTINVSYNSVSMLDLGEDITLCEGETLVLDGTTSGASYLWQDNSTNSTYIVSEAGAYWLEVTLDNCTTIDTINVSYNPIPMLDLGEDITLCEGETLVLDGSTSGASYLWQDNSMNSTYTISEAGIYWLEVTVNNCTTTDTVNVSYNPVPILDLGEDVTLCEGEALVLDATTIGASYLWQDNSTTPTYNVVEAGTYWVEVTVDDCTTISTITIDSENCNCTVSMPNVFTPNSDDLNDEFSPISNCDFNEYSLIIFNRWGEKIFETNNANDAWDGTYKGKLCPMEVYVYLLRYTYDGDSIEEKGSVTLLR